MNETTDQMDRISKSREKMNIGWCLVLVTMCLLHSHTKDSTIMDILGVLVSLVSLPAIVIGTVGMMGLRIFMFGMVVDGKHTELGHVAGKAREIKVSWWSVSIFTIWYIVESSIDNWLFFIPIVLTVLWLVVALAFKRKVIKILYEISKLTPEEISIIKIMLR